MKRFKAKTVRQYCAGNHGGACVKHGTAHDVCEIMGPQRAPSVEQARRLITFAVAGGREAKELLAQHIAATGECVWHAAAEMTNKSCWCAACTRADHPAHLWSLDSVRLYRASFEGASLPQT